MAVLMFASLDRQHALFFVNAAIRGDRMAN